MKNQGSPTQSTESQRGEGRAGAAQTQSEPSGSNRASTSSSNSTAANVNLSADQKKTIRQTVIQSNNAPRVTNVNFSLSVGTAIPTTVRLAPVPTTLVEIHPAWRGYQYFIVGEQIIIVSTDHKIVAVIAV
jgi:hypothetical protein